MTMLRPLLVSFGTLTLLTGLAYPLAFTGAAQLAFPAQARGGLLLVDGQTRGSRLIAQATEDPRFFWCRPSATGAFPTNAGASGGSNLAASNPSLADAVAARVKALQASDPDNPEPIPQDLVTASASGLDPHLSPEAARWQAPRVAHLRHRSLESVLALVARHTEHSAFGPDRVCVLALNLDLERAR